MDMKSILLGNIDELNEIKERLVEQTGLRDDIHKLTMDKLNLEKDIVTEEKLVEDTIELTIKKRREELEAEYDKEINSNNDKQKSIKNKRESTKKKAVAKRISNETKEIKKENKSLHKEIRTTFKEKGVPRFCDSSFYYALYCTSEAKEFITFAIMTVIFIALIPNSVAFFFQGFWLWRVLIYIGIVVVFIAFYMLIYKVSKAKDRAIFEQMRPNRTQIVKNVRKIKRIKKQIRRDTDESLYNLENFDTEISDLDEILSKLEQDKTKALIQFEEFTIQAITDEIINRSKDKIREMKEETINISSILIQVEAKQKDVTLNIASSYEAYLGSEFMNVNKINALINIMEEGRASTIAEAMGVSKGRA